MQAHDIQHLFDKLKDLPPEQVAEVEDFVDFLAARKKSARSAASERLGKAMEKLDALNLPPLSREEVQAEIKAARRSRADRS